LGIPLHAGGRRAADGLVVLRQGGRGEQTGGDCDEEGQVIGHVFQNLMRLFGKSVNKG